MIQQLFAIWMKATSDMLHVAADSFWAPEEEPEPGVLADAISSIEVPEDREEYDAHGPTAIGFRR